MLCLDNVTDLKDDIEGQVNGAWVPFKKTDVCEAIEKQQKCPIPNGVTVMYVLSISISKIYPTVSTIVCLSAIIDFTLTSKFQINVIVRSNMTDTVNSNPGICTCFEMQGKIV